ncbi:DinB family protein [Pseudorhodoplanes sp.]|uniref:DinB family protein n=1 Tax=Pseudorhodoplanes sp. TaxID=1934341 RepID=UPI002C3C29A8|nr:DinB family protein [Pseudorhodoplanes sp.]HWV52243.1 DinB family protein [Pseudorhodoplanes sp.]
MIDAAYVQRMALYNRWQNRNLFGVAGRLSDSDRRLDRGAFFGSIHATLSHLLWADRVWMSRFAGWTKPEGGIRESVSLYPDWGRLSEERAASDERLIAWSNTLDPQWLANDLTWFSGAVQREVSKPIWQLLVHFFNHQTHHRGQVHAMLTQAGGKPHDTDLFAMPE